MASANKTENYNLSQFGDSDKPSWRGDYSGDMSKIDAGLLEAKTAAVTAQNTANTAQSTASELSDAVDTAQSTADAAQATATAAQTTANAALPTTTAQAQYLTQANAAGTYETSVSHDTDMTSLRNDLLSKTAAASTYETQSAAATAHTTLDNKITANASAIAKNLYAENYFYARGDKGDLERQISPNGGLLGVFHSGTIVTSESCTITPSFDGANTSGAFTKITIPETGIYEVSYSAAINVMKSPVPSLVAIRSWIGSTNATPGKGTEMAADGATCVPTKDYAISSRYMVWSTPQLKKFNAGDTIGAWFYNESTNETLPLTVRHHWIAVRQIR